MKFITAAFWTLKDEKNRILYEMTSCATCLKCLEGTPFLRAHPNIPRICDIKKA